MICFDLENKLVLVNDRLASLETLKYIDDEALLESFKTNFYTYLPLNENDYGLTHQALSWAFDKVGNLVEYGWPKVQALLKSLLPETLEGWVHMGVDTISLILDIIGPFTGGLGNAASMAIDIIHGLYYIASGYGATFGGILPDHRNEEFEYILCGLITLGFAFVPAVGNVGSMAFKKALKAEGKIVAKSAPKFLEKMLSHPTLGKPIVKIFEFLAKMTGNAGKWLAKVTTKVFDKALLPIKWLFDMLGITKIFKWLCETIDKVLFKVFDAPGVKEVFKKHGIDVAKSSAAYKATKDGAKFGVKKAAFNAERVAKIGDDVLKNASKEHKRLAKLFKDQTNLAFQSLVLKAKMALVHSVLGDKSNITEAIDGVLSFFIKESPKKEKTAIKDVGFDEAQYHQFIKDYAFFLDESDKEEIDADAITKIQEFLTSDDLAELDYKSEITKSGVLDIATVQGLRTLFEFLKETETDDSDSEENVKAKEIVEFSTNAIKELDKIEGNYVGFLKSIKLPELPKTNEKLLNFNDFSKVND